MAYRKRTGGALYPLSIFCVVFAFYIKFLDPGPAPWDASEYAIASATLGIPHSPGYPMYTWVGFLFTNIPVGEIAYRVNLMSALFGAATISIVYLIGTEIISVSIPDVPGWVRRLAAASGALSLAFTLTFWSFSEVASIRTFQSFFLALSLFAVGRWAREPTRVGLWFAALSYGLALAAHTSNLLYLPALLVLAWPRLRHVKWFSRETYIAAALALAGPITYVYVYLRAIQRPAYAWGFTGTPGAWLDYVQGKPFASMRFYYPLSSLPSRILWFYDLLRPDFSRFLLYSAVIGALVLLRRERRWLVALFLLAGADLGFYLFYLGIDRGDFIPSFMVAALLGAVGGAFLGSLIWKFVVSRHSNLAPSLQRALPVARGMVVFLLIVGSAIAPYQGYQRNHAQADGSQDPWGPFSAVVMDLLPENSTVLADWSGTPFIYQTLVNQEGKYVRFVLSEEDGQLARVEEGLRKGPTFILSWGLHSMARDVLSRYTLRPAVVALSGPILYEVESSPTLSIRIPDLEFTSVDSNLSNGQRLIGLGVSWVSQMRSFAVSFKSKLSSPISASPIVRLSVADSHGEVFASEVPLTVGRHTEVTGDCMEYQLIIIIPPGPAPNSLILIVTTGGGSRTVGPIPLKVQS